MSLQRYTRSVDGSIPVPALLYDDEELLESQDTVGIYDGLQKSPNHQNGTVHITTHRLFYIDSARARSRSFALDLALVARTDYYAGLFTSSSKVTLHLSPASSPTPTPNDDPAGDSWVCEVCNFRNPPGASPATAKCTLCGVPRSKSSTSTPAPAPTPASAIGPSALSTFAQHVSSSLPASPPPEPTTDALACPACTFLNHPALTACEICGTALPRPHPHALLATQSAPASRPDSPSPQPDDGADTRIIKLSFRRGGDKAFYAVVKRSLLGKAWESKDAPARTDAAAARTGPGGIDGLIRTVESSAATRSTDMSSALQDLEALMTKARDMVRLAGELNERLTASSALAANPYSSGGAGDMNGSGGGAGDTDAALVLAPAGEPEAATFVRSSLAQLGLQMPNTPVTLDMVRDEKRWHAELARELAGLLQGADSAPAPGQARARGMMRERGIVGLDEVWGGWNRARGVALIPPATFLLVLPHLPTHTTPPIAARTFASGLRVLHTPAYAAPAFAKRLEALVRARPRTTLEVAEGQGVPVGLVAEMVREAEEAGVVCRDEGEGGGGGGGGGGSEWDIGGGAEVRWWVNVFVGYVWDGQEV
ncbi:hypothetical protein DENSPDRAFT_812276 [Dentipellis sp. KUC8613]|nr:hypothetical protein DENSPDRAFT_812276 [Dentipellis sp. KUC8613]